jgi:hypothetical protein
MDEMGEVTRLLAATAKGDRAAYDELLPFSDPPVREGVRVEVRKAGWEAVAGVAGMAAGGGCALQLYPAAGRAMLHGVSCLARSARPCSFTRLPGGQCCTVRPPG